MKRLIDVAGALTAMAILSPLFVAAAAAVKVTSKGPVFFKQARLGLGGSSFRIIKFRSMYVDAPVLRTADGACVTLARDARVTPVGRVLRSTSIDELPQLLNVLRGQMSLVGPRPDQADQLRFYTAAERVKLEVRPGLTGLAQISGRNSISWERRKQLDCEYVRRQSVWLDLEILIRTVGYVLARHGIDNETGKPTE